MWSQLFKWLCAQPREVPCTWEAYSSAFSTSPHRPAPPNYLGHRGFSLQESTAGAEELQGKIYPSVTRNKAADLAAFSFILSVKDFY